jgi:hypothetical protein
MKRKVKKYAGGMLTDSSGNPVRSSSGQPVRTRSADEIAEDNKSPFGRNSTKSVKSEVQEDRPTTSGVEDYESLGKRAPAKSTWDGSTEIKEDTYKETESDEPRRKITDYSTNKGTTTYLQKEDAPSTVSKTKIKKPVAKKVDAPNESAAETARLKRQADSARKKALEESDKPLESVHPESYFPPLRGLNALAKGLASKKAIEEVGKRAGSEISAFAKKAGDDLSTFVRRPREVFRQAEKDITPRAPRLGNEPPKLGMKKGGAVKKMASGGKTSSASSRGDGIAQRGKTKGRMC